MIFDRKIPFNDLPLLPPEVELESKGILKKAITANRELAELKGAGDAISNRSILINSIVLQEARLSSEIENIVANWNVPNVLLRGGNFTGRLGGDEATS